MLDLHTRQCSDAALAPPGKSAVVTTFSSDYSYWKELYKELERIEAENMDITFNVIDQLEHRLLDITGQIEVVEFLTPLKVVRYTGNRQGSQEG